MSDTQKQAVVLDILEKFVPYAETFWTTSDLTQPNTGRYSAVGSGVTQPRGAGDIAYAYVTLLEARPDQAAFGGVARETLIDHTIQSIRHEAYTNALSGAGYNKWGKGSWQAALEAYSWAFAAYRLWDRLDADTQTLIRTVVTGEANILITKPIASGEEGDTGAEDNGWNAPLPALAAVIFPDDPNAAAWQDTAIRLALNASSTTADATATQVIDGKPLNAWMASVNLHPDLTLENHGFFNPIYQQVVHVDINDAAIAYANAGRALPEAFSFRTNEIWENVLMRLATDDGDFAMTAGQDWTSKDYQHLEYLGIMATRLQRVDASVLESRALELVALRQAAHPNGSMLGQTQIGYETMLVKRLAATWWSHRLFGPSPEPTRDEFVQARAAANGVKTYPYSDFIAARLERAFVSMSWDSAKPMGLVVPHGEANLDDPIFSYYAPTNLVGAVSGAVGAHSCACEADRFSTAGSIGTRRFSMTAFPDGVTMLLDRGTGSTFTYSLENITGVTGERPIWSTAGSGVGSLTGNWVNAAERLAMIVRGGAGISAANVTGTNNQIVVTGSTGTGSGNRGALILPLVAHDQTALLEPFASQPAMPDSWSALSGRAADSTVRLAIARWGGSATAPIVLADDRGAPVPREDAVLENNTARFTTRLNAPASEGQIVHFFVQAPATLHGQQDGEGTAVLQNPGTEPVNTTVTYVAGAEQSQVKNRTLAGGEQVRARLVAGELTLAGAELEPLLVARAALAGLLEELEAERADQHLRQHRPCHHWPPAHVAALMATTSVTLHAVDKAIAEATDAEPDTKRAARAVDLALDAIQALEHAARHSRLPPDLEAATKKAADTAEQALEEALAQAYTLMAWVEPVGLAQPGEPLTLRVTVVNRGTRTAHDGVVTLTAPDGWTAAAPVAAFASLAPGATATAQVTLVVPATAAPGETAAMHAELAYRRGHRTRTAVADTQVPIDPIAELVPIVARLPLAMGATNQATFHLVNLADHDLGVTLVPVLPDGVTAEIVAPPASLPALGSVDLSVTLKGLSRTSGSGSLALTVNTAGGASVTSSVELLFSDDLALNTVAAPWPLMTATSSQAAYPPSLACDGSNSTFWVSAGTVSGEGPSPTKPQMLTVDLGFPARIGSVTMVPRTNYGPKAYGIEISDDGTTWQPVADIPSPANGATIATTLTPVTTRLVRLRITGGWDTRVQPPRNVQVSSLIVKAAP